MDAANLIENPQDEVRRESHMRSIAKTLSWRFVATATTALLVLAFTGDASIALTVGGVEVFAKMLLYYLHERVWARV